MLLHLVARAKPGPHPLRLAEPADWLWPRLRETFPHALAVVLMPNHLHLLGAFLGPDAPRQALGAVLSGFTRRHGGPGWSPVPDPEEIPDVAHLSRQVRYVALNPCRARLAADPLQWPWSTHRDVVGAITDPWVDATRLATALGRSPRRFAEAHHAYVSGDPSVAVAGTPFPEPAFYGGGRAPLPDLLAAAAATTRADPEAVRRRGPTRAIFVALAKRFGWDAGAIAQVAGTTRAAIHKASTAPDLGPATLCLGDERLRLLTPRRG